MSDVWYIAGPMRGIPNYNYPLFDKARDYLAYSDPEAVIISPADEDREAGVVDETGPSVVLTDDFDIYEVLRKDIAIVSQEATHLCLLPNWFQSEGARVEAHVAAAVGVIIYEWDDNTIWYRTAPQILGVLEGTVNA